MTAARQTRGVPNAEAVYPERMTAPHTPDPRLGENEVSEPDDQSYQEREEQPEVMKPSVEDPE